MNKQRILHVANCIERQSVHGLGFNMSDWISIRGDEPDRSGHMCDTTACLAGWAAALGNPRRRFLLPAVCDLKSVHAIYNGDGDVEEAARAWLDLTPEQATRLFRHGPKGVRLRDVTAAQGVRVLRYLAEHEVVDWDAAQAA